MAFKGGSDDPRESLAYKLRKILLLKAKRVLCTDPYVTRRPAGPAARGAARRPTCWSIAAPHAEYRDLATDKPVVDIWGMTGRGVRV